MSIMPVLPRLDGKWGKEKLWKLTGQQLDQHTQHEQRDPVSNKMEGSTNTRDHPDLYMHVLTHAPLLQPIPTTPYKAALQSSKWWRPLATSQWGLQWGTEAYNSLANQHPRSWSWLLLHETPSQNQPLSLFPNPWSPQRTCVRLCFLFNLNVLR